MQHIFILCDSLSENFVRFSFIHYVKISNKKEIFLKGHFPFNRKNIPLS